MSDDRLHAFADAVETQRQVLVTAVGGDRETVMSISALFEDIGNRYLDLSELLTNWVRSTKAN